MELTAERVDKIEATRQLVEELIEYASEHESGPFDEENLRILEAQLDVLHQALSMAVAQKDGIQGELDTEVGDE